MAREVFDRGAHAQQEVECVQRAWIAHWLQPAQQLQVAQAAAALDQVRDRGDGDRRMRGVAALDDRREPTAQADSIAPLRADAALLELVEQPAVAGDETRIQGAQTRRPATDGSRLRPRRRS